MLKRFLEASRILVFPGAADDSPTTSTLGFCAEASGFRVLGFRGSGFGIYKACHVGLVELIGLILRVP